MIKKQSDVQATLNNIKRLQYERGISDAQMAREIGGNTTRQDIHKLLNHRNTMPKLDWLISISEVLEVSLEEIIVLKNREDV